MHTKDEMHWLEIMGAWLNRGTHRPPATWEGLLSALEDVTYIREELEVVLTSEIISPSFSTLPS
jgi:hypothetical protein